MPLRIDGRFDRQAIAEQIGPPAPAEALSVYVRKIFVAEEAGKRNFALFAVERASVWAFESVTS